MIDSPSLPPLSVSQLYRQSTCHTILHSLHHLLAESCSWNTHPSLVLRLHYRLQPYCIPVSYCTVPPLHSLSQASYPLTSRLLPIFPVSYFSFSLFLRFSHPLHSFLFIFLPGIFPRYRAQVVQFYLFIDYRHPRSFHASAFFFYHIWKETEENLPTPSSGRLVVHHKKFNNTRIISENLPRLSDMVNSVTASYVVSDFILLATGALLIAAGVIWEKELSTEPTTESVARFLLLKNAPLMGTVLP